MSLEHIQILSTGTTAWNLWRKEHPDVRPDLRRAPLSGRDLRGANLGFVDLENAELDGAKLGALLAAERANLRGSDLSNATLTNSDLVGVDLGHSCLAGADLRGSSLRMANLEHADLTGAFFGGADLRNAKLCYSNVRNADLGHTDLREANLEVAVLVRTNLQGAKLTGARVYGSSVWNAQVDEKTEQADLIVTPEDDPEVMVDNLEVAQFVYLLLKNEKIRDVITTVTSKAVLILGRFTDQRKALLDTVRDELRRRRLVPILFDWPKSERRDLTETIQLLANLARFVVADVTEAKSIPQELSHIIPFMPSVPIVPLILASQREYEMFEHWRRYTSVLPEFCYDSPEHLLIHFDEAITAPVKKWEEETQKAKVRERLLSEKNKQLEQRIRELEDRLGT